jgi:8-oxo-dGTP pyrophosphatase MutT (NUDIX family)
MPALVPRPASTVVVLRSTAAASVEVLLVRRNDKVAFMAGAHVFPGGRVDDEDRARATELPRNDGPSRFPDLTAASELPFRIAAVREMQEEAALTLAASDLIPFAHWVTPEVETRRYDTRFFLARMPPGQTARHDDGETIALAWLTPSEAIERCRRGEIMLPPPTWTTLKQLARFRTADETFAWATTNVIVRVQPGLHKGPHETMLTLPGDPLYPAIPGWEVPEDTRFVLEEGKRWKPTRP